MTTYLFVHQNFPGQYGQLVRHLAAQPRNRVYFITQSSKGEIPGVRKLVYKPSLASETRCHPYALVLDAALRTGTAVAAVCKRLRNRGVFPDLVVGHCGWGETLMIKDVFPKARVLSNFEFFYHAEGVDIGFDREFAPRRDEDAGRLRVRNAINFMSADASDWGHTATAWQHGLFPESMRSRISILHEGVDTNRYKPNPSASLTVGRNSVHVTRKSEVITYVARNLEPYRGFHVLMRSLPELLRKRPRAQVLIVGGDEVSYGTPPRSDQTHRQLLMKEVGAALDLDRVHFMGTVAPDVYLTVLQLSSVHVYLTYPFVLSWSFVEAMSTGCTIVASGTPPVLEMMRSGENGLLVDFFDPAAICDRIDAALDDPQMAASLGRAARQTIIARLDFDTRILPRWSRLFDDLMARRTPKLDAVCGEPTRSRANFAAPTPLANA
jgi:glycosyltransferase involved in cell wall biosynthesis